MMAYDNDNHLLKTIYVGGLYKEWINRLRYEVNENGSDFSETENWKYDFP